ncbi:GNAT family N-acetyltransferase [Listeria fleischmannii]|jgi:predicted GNAT family N-acyltransferase|uniref:GNAT family N-acetyltransferase n=1 Tax=Listeria fleischmannii TaxID=1069827 RepID=UPI000254F01C|nr:GNAT family N-acetyltransferase [Listeria fleischmannii]EIA19836.1 GCN5-like N-acetyltransferase [Listeria fleischmannii subsp. coloradonensis]STY46619.1 putative acetyltransferase [Listeria fleischmannii subsp. coloradonensis]
MDFDENPVPIGMGFLLFKFGTFGIVEKNERCILLQIRKMEKADLDALRTLYKEVRGRDFSWTKQEELSEMDFDRDTDGELVLVMENSGDILGFVGIFEPEHFIHHLYVNQNARGSGVGRELLLAALKTSKATFSLKCVAENEKALLFYKKMGFKKVSEGFSEDGRYFVLEGSFLG